MKCVKCNVNRPLGKKRAGEAPAAEVCASCLQAAVAEGNCGVCGSSLDQDHTVCFNEPSLVSA